MRSLYLKFFLWFLFAFGVTAAVTASVISLLADERWGQRSKDLMLAEAHTACTLVEHSSQHDGDEWTPVVDSFFSERHASAMLFDERGVPQREWLAGRPRGETLALLQPLVADVRQHGEAFEFKAKHPPLAAVHCANGVLAVLPPRARPPDRSPWQAAIPVLVIIVVSWLVSWPLARHLSRPLTILTRTAERFTAGDFKPQLDDGRTDEIGRLNRAFTAMATTLSGWFDDKQRLLGDVAHELKTPLARQRIAIELIKLDSAPTLMPQLNRLTRDTEALSELVDELLEYARADARFALNRSTVNLGQLAQSTADNLAHLGVPIRVHVADDVPDLQLDRRVIGRVIDNVVENACRHGKTPVDVSVLLEGRKVRIAVRDYGPGVPKESLTHIFEPFIRLDDSRDRRTGGTGLGAAIAQRGVVSHNGTITASLPEGGGLAVDIFLPAKS